ncbi:MAG: hypothetical protein EP330_20430 [Deltaproteobacteria bacterium]|nr:MAG: hypothetical protein EP330_20430 [Deltaproteobacteria bacterium]
MDIHAELDEVRLTLRTDATYPGAMFFLPFALIGSLFFIIGLVMLGFNVSALFDGSFEVGVTLFIGLGFTFVGGTHTTIGIGGITSPLHRIEVTLDPHRVTLRRYFGLVPVWTRELPLSEIEGVAVDGTSLVLQRTHGEERLSLRGMKEADVVELAAMLDAAARAESAGQAPEALRQLVGRNAVHA